MCMLDTSARLALAVLSQGWQNDTHEPTLERGSEYCSWLRWLAEVKSLSSAGPKLDHAY